MTQTVIRPYLPNDLPALVELLNAADRVDNAGLATTVQALAHQLQEPGMNPNENCFVAEQDGRLLGYARVFCKHAEDLDRMIVLGIVHPAARRQGLGTALVRRAAERGRAMQTPGQRSFLHMPVRERVAGAAELASSLGLQAVRFFYYMECQDLTHLPEPTLPHGFHLRNFVQGQDEIAFHEAYNDGFSDHWGFAPSTFEQVQHWAHSPSFRSEDNLLAIDEQGHIAGLCLVLFPPVQPGSARLGMIDDLAVPHAFRRRGIGRALLLAGMRHIREQSASTAALSVDVDNPNQALRLYESVGFVTQSRSISFQEEL